MTRTTEHDIRRAADRMAHDLTRRVADEPAVRATLRRGVGRRVEDPAMLPLHGFVTPYLGDLHERARPRRFPDQGEAVERAFYAVAALIAAQSRQARDRDSAGADDGREHTGESPAEAPGGEDAATPASVGEPAAAGDTGETPPRDRGLGTTLGEAVGKGRLNADTTEQRLHLLCRQSLDGVHAQLPRLLAHATAKGVRPDWGRLVLDLARWGGERDHVAKEWAQGFHRAIGRARQAASQNSTQTDTQSIEEVSTV
ncbi:type I-E CRISPR-associated protein Cse2/CasB [Nocardiopsis sp. NPDC101807]|uniref:type I-E CRISPR-associated protein Cse2/CasB n=1 Tax=Nocardiopsis sp. NPDC101807 TaxID=3364339 RepID=UPI0037FACDF9